MEVVTIPYAVGIIGAIALVVILVGIIVSCVGLFAAGRDVWWGFRWYELGTDILILGLAGIALAVLVFLLVSIVVELI